eukprot:m.189729 g.189729  ORF g.189729 m.189729 type:complete len:248 (+) comp39421_c0_seq6:972-1715(+)
MNLSSICEVVRESSLIQNSMKDTCIQAVQFLREKKPWLLVMILLPQLEHGLRRLFAHVNECPWRVVTAESATLYTTFDEMLSVSLPDESSNQLFVKIDENIMIMLFDLLVHPDGLRLRDRLSHGDADIYSLPSELADYVLTLFTALAWQCQQPQDKTPDSGAVQSVLSSVAVYKTLFHPLAVVKRQAFSLAELLVSVRRSEFPEELKPINFSLYKRSFILLASVDHFYQEEFHDRLVFEKLLGPSDW